MRKCLVLVGGGHAHLKMIAELAENPLDGWQVYLVSPSPNQIYSGMLPGWVAGRYALEACSIALDALARRAGIIFHETELVDIDLPGKEITCADGTSLRFDLLSLDTGSMPATSQLPGAAEHALTIRPIDAFVKRWPALVDRILGQCRRFDLVVLGAGAAGVEVTLAIQRAAAIGGWSHVRISLIGSSSLPMDGGSESVRRRVAKVLAQRGVGWCGERRAIAIDPGQIHFQDGLPVSFDACLVLTGPAAPDWPARSGLATDERGFIRVGPTLQSVSHPHVFAGGDVAAYADPRAKSGVYAVRAGPVLASNLRAAAQGRALRRWRPQRRALYLLSTGRDHAIASYGGLSWAGRWVWRWKDWIDTRFVRRYASPSIDAAQE